jgi:hypothetical protein
MEAFMIPKRPNLSPFDAVLASEPEPVPGAVREQFEEYAARVHGLEPRHLRDLDNVELAKLVNSVVAAQEAAAESESPMEAAVRAARVAIASYLVGYRDGRRKNGVDKGNGGYV